MWSINIRRRDAYINVTVSRWGQRGPYPTILLDFELISSEGEPELGILERVGRALETEADRRRRAL